MGKEGPIDRRKRSLKYSVVRRLISADAVFREENAVRGAIFRAFVAAPAGIGLGQPEAAINHGDTT